MQVEKLDICHFQQDVNAVYDFVRGGMATWAGDWWINTFIFYHVSINHYILL